MIDAENWLTANRDETLKQYLESFGRTEKQLEEDIRILTDWLKTQLHLPEIPRRNHIMNTLLLNKFSIEKCKQRLDMYYTIRTLLPEIYDHLDSKAMLKRADITYAFPLPKRTAAGDRVLIYKLMDSNANNYDVYLTMGYCYNNIDLWMNEDIITTSIVIVDIEKISMAHVKKVNLVHLKKAVMVLEKVHSNRVKQMHFLNCPSFAYSILTLLKSLVKPRLASRLFFHEDFSQMEKILPLEYLPKDYGGSELSLYELNELWKKKLVKYGDRFDVLGKIKTNEKLRPSPLVNDDILGFHGNFRKLEMD